MNKKLLDVTAHYDKLIAENNDPFHDPAPLRYAACCNDDELVLYLAKKLG